MLERYFDRPQTVDRIRASWLGPAIEQCATWLIERGHAARNLARYVPIQMHFGAFAQARGATRYEDLPAYVDAFVTDRIARPDHRRAPGAPRPRLTQEIRWPIEQMLRLVVPGFVGHRRHRVLQEPFAEGVPGFFAYLRNERGLREETVVQYAYHLRQLEARGLLELVGEPEEDAP